MDLHDLADDHLISTATALTLGIDPAGMRARVRAGTLFRVIRGWYAVRSPNSERAPWEGDDTFDEARRRHRLLVTALLKSFDGRVVASHQSALVLHELPMWQADLTTAHLCRTANDHTRHRRSAVIHPRVEADPVAGSGGYQTVTPAHAAVQVGLYPPDDATCRVPMDSLIAADAALHRGLVGREELERAVAAHTHHPGIPVVRQLLAHVDGRHESPGETRLAHAMRTLGYSFTPQVPLAGSRGYRGDFGLDDEPVVVEFDGLAKYSLASATGPAGSAMARRENLAAEKRREEDVRMQATVEFARFTWSELDDLHLVRKRIEAARARARRGRHR
ncbi:Transcriptional regulator, AbiEi antitoxin, Type IV TA system [Pedococcus dokdonensis]|uniref:Transcriptional regulator, AbiEi antitoxin, Type IV TA system n=1 Tax=Pedococcus dokdonensis TaxID=443156 RepID=A0A1H0KSR1_9MICO|nr:hypothetical protein [Pedococcus dokdonensis]SDO58823.1 Transcriptional regulator, AbiEi antitoxin, Type IV TA system [Pedococcus dokdonensis]